MSKKIAVEPGATVEVTSAWLTVGKNGDLEFNHVSGEAEIRVYDDRTGEFYEADWDVSEGETRLIYRDVPPHLRVAEHSKSSWEEMTP